MSRSSSIPTRARSSSSGPSPTPSASTSTRISWNAWASDRAATWPDGRIAAQPAGTASAGADALVPGRGANCEGDLLELKKRFPTASHEVLACALLDLADPCIITIIDNDHVHRRRSNAYRVRKELSGPEKLCQRTSTVQPADPGPRRGLDRAGLADSPGRLEARDPAQRRGRGSGFLTKHHEFARVDDCGAAFPGRQDGLGRPSYNGRRHRHVARIILAFNGDLESRLALHWLVHEHGHEVITLSINLGQGTYLEPLGELALELGASGGHIIDRQRVPARFRPAGPASRRGLPGQLFPRLGLVDRACLQDRQGEIAQELVLPVDDVSALAPSSRASSPSGSRYVPWPRLIDSVMTSWPRSCTSQCRARRDSRSPLKARIMRATVPVPPPVVGRPSQAVRTAWEGRPTVINPNKLVVASSRNRFLVHDAAQDLALPVGLVNRPALHGPALFAHQGRPAVLVDVALAQLLRTGQLLAHAVGVAAATVDVIVVDDGDDARVRQVE